MDQRIISIASAGGLLNKVDSNTIGVETNSADINVNSADISTNTFAIYNNSADIAANTVSISANTNSINSNTTEIANLNGFVTAISYFSVTYPWNPIVGSPNSYLNCKLTVNCKITTLNIISSTSADVPFGTGFTVDCSGWSQLFEPYLGSQIINYPGLIWREGGTPYYRPCLIVWDPVEMELTYTYASEDGNVTIYGTYLTLYCGSY